MIPIKSTEQVRSAKSGKLAQRPYTALLCLKQILLKTLEILKCDRNYIPGRTHMLATFGLVLPVKQWSTISD